MTWIALAYHLASRLGYVLYIGIALARRERRTVSTARTFVTPEYFSWYQTWSASETWTSFAVLDMESAAAASVAGTVQRISKGRVPAVGAMLRRYAQRMSLRLGSESSTAR